MNKYFRIIGIISILCFSFYCAEQTALFMQRKDPIYETIEAVKDDYYVSSVNGLIEDDFIMPGVSGLAVDVLASFKNMKQLGAFQSNKLVFEEIKPSVLLSENKNKIIRQGNYLKNGVTIILENDALSEYLEEMGVAYVILTTKENMLKHYAHGTKVNFDLQNYDEVEKVLVKRLENNDFCLISNNHRALCESKKKLLVEPSKIIKPTNFVTLFSEIEAGDLLFIQKNLELTNLKLLLEQIRFKGLQVLSISDLLRESR